MSANSSLVRSSPPTRRGVAVARRVPQHNPTENKSTNKKPVELRDQSAIKTKYRFQYHNHTLFAMGGRKKLQTMASCLRTTTSRFTQHMQSQQGHQGETRAVQQGGQGVVLRVIDATNGTCGSLASTGTRTKVAVLADAQRSCGVASTLDRGEMERVGNNHPCAALLAKSPKCTTATSTC